MSYFRRLAPEILVEIEASMHRIRRDSARLIPLMFPRMLDPLYGVGRPVIAPQATKESGHEHQGGNRSARGGYQGSARPASPSAEVT